MECHQISVCCAKWLWNINNVEMLTFYPNMLFTKSLVEEYHGFQQMLVMHYQHTTNYKQMIIHKVQCEGTPTTKETSPPSITANSCTLETTPTLQSCSYRSPMTQAYDKLSRQLRICTAYHSGWEYTSWGHPCDGYSQIMQGRVLYQQLQDPTLHAEQGL